MSAGLCWKGRGTRSVAVGGGLEEVAGVGGGLPGSTPEVGRRAEAEGAAGGRAGPEGARGVRGRARDRPATAAVMDGPLIRRGGGDQ